MASDRSQDSQSIFLVTKPKCRTKNKETDEIGPLAKEPLQFFHTPVILMDKLSRLIYSTIEERVVATRNLAKYNPKRAVVLCGILAADIKRRVRQLEMRNYRIVTMVCIAPKHDQGVSYKMAVHGDHLVDFFGNNKYETNTGFILATVYLVYKHYGGIC